ncbi:putative pentatricopeptide repeat-containing protein At1g02420 [Cornus florida]|uniref:putative pentatricopeptide repeat-containing protein At1g02420 n=1 Tax=Cornus florida TaxID=4283 RepID=UPI00289CF97F|nr:putative pentatricopeptide repeat-containing protein At1g02420 [Cornus florida]XP_059665199.1 putative pentatricopeptide repeat-containing protein At1g02420 [Cornus florida]XP_059665200.1 putative pentatricopeptide repeat-containing protein At1g02420 [Cornus florida]
MLILKPLSLRSSTRYVPSIFLYFDLQNPCSFHSRSFDPSENSALDDDVETVFRIISSSSSSNDLKQSLKSTKVLLSNDLIDRVLKRVRFSHANPLQALEFFNYTANRRGFYHTSFSLDTMLYILGRNRKFDKIWDVLIETKKKDQSLISPRTVQVVLARIAKACSVRQTVDSFKMFRKFVPEYGINCFNALLRTLCQEKSMTDARNVYHSLKHQFQPNLRTFNILLSGWKSPEEAEVFFEEMRQMGVKPDLVSYNCLIDVYCKGRDIEKAYKIVEKMREEDISPDVISYTSIIGGLGLVGQPDKARDVLKEMREYGCYPDVAAYNAAIRNFCIAKRLGDAYMLMEEMVVKGLNPNATTYNVIFRSFFWSNDLRSSWSLYQRMKDTGCLPNTQSCMFLIRLFSRNEKVEMALELWSDMVEKGFGSYILVSDVLFDLLCDMGKLMEAEKCFLQMVEKGHKPSNVSFRRIKVLMELANKHEALQNLSEKMVAFGSSIQKPKSKEGLAEMSSSNSFTC